MSTNAVNLDRWPNDQMGLGDIRVRTRVRVSLNSLQSLAHRWHAKRLSGMPTFLIRLPSSGGFTFTAYVTCFNESRNRLTYIESKSF